MKKSLKIAVGVAAILLVLGIALAGIGFWGMGFHFGALNTEDIVSSTFEISEAFRDISIESDSADLYFAASEDGVCRVECVNFAHESYSVHAENGTLTITKNDDRAWHENIRLFSFGETYVRIYLPEESYTSLQIHESTGDIEMPAAFTFAHAVLRTSTGDICWLAPVSEELSITTDTGDAELRGTSPRSLALKTDTGDISVSEVRDAKQISIETDTGEVELTNAGCTRLSADSNTGDIALKSVIVDGLLEVKTDTGDLVFDRSDAAEIFVQTNTGDVTGTLISDKVFLIETNTGDVDVPKSVTGARCEIITDTGDIELRIEQ